jgi:hypothetical protein
MWDEMTTRVYRLADGTLVDWERLSAALNSAICGCLELGNVRVVEATILAVFGDSDVVHTRDGFLNRGYVDDAWRRIAAGVSSTGDCDAMWSLFFKAFGVSAC